MNQTEMLKKLEWTGTLVKPSDHPLTCCPECGYIPTTGHTETCELNRLINQPQIDCPVTGRELRNIEEIYLNPLLGGQHYSASLKILRLADWIDLQQSQPSTLPKEKQ